MTTSGPAGAIASGRFSIAHMTDAPEANTLPSHNLLPDGSLL